MIDPRNVTSYGLPPEGLEEQLLFWVLAAGKTALVAAGQLEAILDRARFVASHMVAADAGPFDVLRAYRAPASPRVIRKLLRNYGVGCHGLKSRCINALLDLRLDLARCSVEELDAVPGIGPKTARCFVLHTREGADVSGLDTHILAELADEKRRRKARWRKVPSATLTAAGTYAYWERIVRRLAAEAGLSMAEYDLAVWNRRHRRVRTKAPCRKIPGD